MTSEPATTDKLPGLDRPGSEPFDIPPFMRRANAKADEIIAAEASEKAQPEAPPEPTVEQVLDLIKRLSGKQDDIERKKNELKNELINRIWQL